MGTETRCASIAAALHACNPHSRRYRIARERQNIKTGCAEAAGDLVLTKTPRIFDSSDRHEQPAASHCAAPPPVAQPTHLRPAGGVSV